MDKLPDLSTGGRIALCTVGILLGALLLAAGWKILEKAGEPGWKAIIPIYNMYTIVRIVEGSGIKFLLFLIPLVSCVYDIFFSIRLAKVFGKGTGFGIGIFLAPHICGLILGFGSAQYLGPLKEAPASDAAEE